MRKFILDKMELNDVMSDLRRLTDAFTNNKGKRLPIIQNFSTDTDYVQVEIGDNGITITDHFPKTDFEALDRLISNAYQLFNKSKSFPVALLDTGLYAVFYTGFGTTARKAINYSKTSNGATALEFDDGCNFDVGLSDGALFFIDDELNFKQLDLVVERNQDAFVIMRKVGGAYVNYRDDLPRNIISAIVSHKH